MQEIAPHVFIDTSYPGVTLGAISGEHGLILIDAPFRAEDIRAWRAALLNLGGGVDRLLINMDAHFDRTLGTRAMECTVVGHEKMAQVFRNRPVTFKTQSAETGSDWEQYSGLGSIRWAPPEITFTHKMFIHWGETPVALESHPGPASGAIWAVLPEDKIVFVGDAVVNNQPPFLGASDIPGWIETLKLLLSPEYHDYILVSGRGGLVVPDQVRQQLNFLQKVQTQLKELVDKKAYPEDTEKLVSGLLTGFDFHPQNSVMYQNRLRAGLSQYFQRHYHSTSEEMMEE
jgi:glyoxylase-like metal-dependent hydrolase (beta-lactamase superfamily II)